VERRAVFCLPVQRQKNNSSDSVDDGEVREVRVSSVFVFNKDSVAGVKGPAKDAKDDEVNQVCNHKYAIMSSLFSQVSSPGFINCRREGFKNQAG